MVPFLSVSWNLRHAVTGEVAVEEKEKEEPCNGNAALVDVEESNAFGGLSIGGKTMLGVVVRVGGDGVVVAVDVLVVLVSPQRKCRTPSNGVVVLVLGNVSGKLE